MTGSGRPPIGHNGGPPLEEPISVANGRCPDCRHWHAPPKAERIAYEYFRLGLSKRRVRRPTGACDRVVLSPGRAPAFSATSAEFGCINFAPKPVAPPQASGGFITIYEGGRIVCQGAEEDLPTGFRQEGLDLADPLEAGNPSPVLPPDPPRQRASRSPAASAAVTERAIPAAFGAGQPAPSGRTQGSSMPVSADPVFVFGSNLVGRHGRGAALWARQHRGARYGQGVGPQGNAYAIPTKDGQLRVLGLDVIRGHVDEFLRYARQRAELRFQLTPIGCGLAGYRPEQIAPMFAGASDNILLPDAFKPFLEGRLASP